MAVGRRSPASVARASDPRRDGTAADLCPRARSVARRCPPQPRFPPRRPRLRRLRGVDAAGRVGVAPASASASAPTRPFVSGTASRSNGPAPDLRGRGHARSASLRMPRDSVVPPTQVAPATWSCPRRRRPAPLADLAREMADGAARDLGERQQPQKRPRRERREHHEHEPGQHPGRCHRPWPSAAPPSESIATIANFDRISATSNSAVRDRPHAPRRPDHRREREREHQHDDVDRGLAHQHLDPQRRSPPPAVSSPRGTPGTARARSGSRRPDVAARDRGTVRRLHRRRPRTRPPTSGRTRRAAASSPAPRC